MLCQSIAANPPVKIDFGVQDGGFIDQNSFLGVNGRCQAVGCLTIQGVANDRSFYVVFQLDFGVFPKDLNVVIDQYRHTQLGNDGIPVKTRFDRCFRQC
nr:hypothetical protein [Haliscomenobacter sp.]